MNKVSKLIVLSLGTLIVVSIVPTASVQWKTVWREDFNGPGGSLPSGQNWKFDLGTSSQGGPAHWGTGEIESYTNSPDNIRLDGTGNLIIIPLRDGSGNWTSARIETQRDDFKPPGGGILAIEGRILMPSITGNKALGYWPAFWALGSPLRQNLSWPGVGEFDILENVNGENRVWGTLHCGVSPGGPCHEMTGLGNNVTCPGASCQSAFHVYRIEWDDGKKELRWYVDGQNYHKVTSNQIGASTWDQATNHGYFILLNVAMGGSFPDRVSGITTPTPQTEPGHPMVIDYVAVYSS